MAAFARRVIGARSSPEALNGTSGSRVSQPDVALAADEVCAGEVETILTGIQGKQGTLSRVDTTGRVETHCGFRQVDQIKDDLHEVKEEQSASGAKLDNLKDGLEALQRTVASLNEYIRGHGRV